MQVFEKQKLKLYHIFSLGAKMPKMKTKGSAKKRFKVTGSGRLLREKAYHSHILTKKSQKRKRNLRKSTLVHPTNEPAIKRMLAMK